jgi:hypothetical protein
VVGGILPEAREQAACYVVDYLVGHLLLKEIGKTFLLRPIAGILERLQYGITVLAGLSYFLCSLE